MYAPKLITSFLLGMFAAVQIADCKHRMARSPDTMEVVFPDYSVEREQNAQELQDKMNQEGEYWQGEGQTNQGKLEDRYENGEGHRVHDRERYEEEKDYQQQQQESYKEDMNERYDSDKEDLETHENTNHEHYANQNGLSAYQGKGEEGNQEFQNEAAEKGDHFEQQGESFVTERGDVENFEGKGPSYNYQRD